jgi:hypothetical protein
MFRQSKSNGLTSSRSERYLELGTLYLVCNDSVFLYDSSSTLIKKNGD